MTSNAALQRIKHRYGFKKAGHTGSLDPLASGMLPICFGEATKFSQYLLLADKRYWVEAILGVKTSTGDAEGEIIAKRPVSFRPITELLHILHRFKGETTQIPSMFSALKYKGLPLYRLARKGLEVERKPRTIHIYGLDLMDYEVDKLTLEVHCSKGTYIRTLVEDIGEALGCGAHVSFLRRLAVGPFSSAQMVPLAQIQSSLQQDLFHYCQPTAMLVQELPAITLPTRLMDGLRLGQSVSLLNPCEEGLVKLLSSAGYFLGVGEVKGGKIFPRQILRTISR
jgi:tRNA pseudouridine55 synthase